jgi:hypothetical protein
MRTRVLAGAATLAVLAAVPVGALASTPTVDLVNPQLHRSTALPSYLAGARSIEDAARAVRTWQVDTAAAAGVPAGLLLAAQAAGAAPGARTRVVRDEDSETVVVIGSGSSLVMSFLQPAADLNGDGSRDVLDVRYGKGKDGRPVAVTIARGGTSGQVLWHRTDVMADGHFIVPAGMSVGSPARPGVLMIDFGFSQDGEATLEVSHRITALTGRTGARLWQHLDKGTLGFQDRFTGSRVPSIAGFLQAAAGAQDVLLSFSDFDDSGDGTDRSGTVTAYRLSGASGKATLSGSAVTSQDSIPYVQGFSDLSGDGRDDYLVLVGGTGSYVQARRGISGAPVWRSTALRLYPGAYVVPAGRLTGTSLEDVAVSTGRPPSTLPSIGTPVGVVDDPTTAAHGSVGLLRGDTGALVLQQVGDEPVRVVRAGSSRVPAIGVATADTSTTVDGTTETLHLRAYDLAGTELYDQTYSVQAPADSEEGGGIGLAGAYAFGDLGADGAQDGVGYLVAINGRNIRQKVFLFDGASGTALPGDHDPLWGSLTGRGDDLVDVSVGSAVTVTALRGRDQRKLFSARLAPGAGMQRADGYAERIRGRCADVLVTASGKSAAYAAVLTATGKVRWSVQHGVQDLRATAARRGPGAAATVCA